MSIHSSGDRSDMNKRRNVLTLVTAAIILAVFVLYMITYVVRKGEVAVLASFGRVVSVIKDPGLYWKAPRPIQTVARLDARLHTEMGSLEEIKMSDGALVVVQAYFNWRIEDPKLFYTRVYTRDEAETLRNARSMLNSIFRDAKNDVFGQHAFSEFMAELGSHEDATPDLGFEAVEGEILESVKALALSEYGVSVTQVGIVRLELPAATTPLVFARMRAERERTAAEIRDEGKAEAVGIRSQAAEESDKIKAAAVGVAEEIRAAGDQEAAKYYHVFAQNPELHDFLLKLEALRTVIDEGTTLILSVDYEIFELLRGMPKGLIKQPVAPGAHD